MNTIRDVVFYAVIPVSVIWITLTLITIKYTLYEIRDELRKKKS